MVGVWEPDGDTVAITVFDGATVDGIEEAVAALGAALGRSLSASVATGGTPRSSR